MRLHLDRDKLLAWLQDPLFLAAAAAVLEIGNELQQHLPRFIAARSRPGMCKPCAAGQGWPIVDTTLQKLLDWLALLPQDKTANTAFWSYVDAKYKDVTSVYVHYRPSAEYLRRLEIRR